MGAISIDTAQAVDRLVATRKQQCENHNGSKGDPLVKPSTSALRLATHVLAVLLGVGTLPIAIHLSAPDAILAGISLYLLLALLALQAVWARYLGIPDTAKGR